MKKLLNKLGLYTKKQQTKEALNAFSYYVNSQSWCKHKYKTTDTKDVHLMGVPIRNFYQECENCGQIRTLER